MTTGTRDEYDEAGIITHDEAAEIALKFINQHFNNPGKERPRASIPTEPRRDDDFRLMAYVRQQRGAGVSILKPWVARTGLRHQGVLLSAIRGCDNEQRNSPTKLLTRCLRETMLVCHCGDATRAATFIELVCETELLKRMDDVRRDLDHLPHHFVMHLLHAAEIIGYKHPDADVRRLWSGFYRRLVSCLHLPPESEAELDARLGADEALFAKAAMETNGLPQGNTVRVTSSPEAKS